MVLDIQTLMLVIVRTTVASGPGLTSNRFQALL